MNDRRYISLDSIYDGKVTDATMEEIMFTYVKTEEDKKIVMEVMEAASVREWMEAYSGKLSSLIVEELWDVLQERDQRELLGNLPFDYDSDMYTQWAEGHIFSSHEYDVWMALVEDVSKEFLIANFWRIYPEDRILYRIHDIPIWFLKKYIDHFGAGQVDQIISYHDYGEPQTLPNDLVDELRKRSKTFKAAYERRRNEARERSERCSQ